MNNSEDKINNVSRTVNSTSIEQFADRLGTLMRKMARNVMSAERNYLVRGVITLPQLWILQEIADAGKCPMLALTRNLGLKSSTLTGLMDRLVKLGLVKRFPSESDRRSVLAELTPKGLRILEHIRAERRQTIIDSFGPLSAQERAGYLAIIEKVADHICGLKEHKPAADKNNR